MNALRKIDELNKKFGFGAKYREAVNWSKLGKKTRIELTLCNVCDPYRQYGEYLVRPAGETLPSYTRDDDWYTIKVFGNSERDAAAKMLRKLDGHTFAIGFCMGPKEAQASNAFITFLNLNDKNEQEGDEDDEQVDS